MSATDGIFIWWLRHGRYRWSRLRRRWFEGRYLAAPLPAVSSLAGIEACLKQVTWTMDGPRHLFDCISYPQTVWASKQDDCDGFAILAATLLQGWLPQSGPVLLTALVSPVKYSHTVCAFRQGDKLAFFSNSELVTGDFPGYGDIVARFTAGTERLIGWDVVRPATLETLEFHRA